MQEKIYNMCLAIAKMAGNNLRRSICRENGQTDTRSIAVKFKDKNELTDLVDEVMKATKPDTSNVFNRRVAQQLIIKARVRILHEIDNGSVFTESVLKSKDARICQKKLIDYMMAERYFKEAFEYDAVHPGMSPSAMDKAKQIIEGMYSINFLSNFYFPIGKPPFMDEGLRERLMDRAFDPMYSFSNEEKLSDMMQKKYLKDLSSKKEYFSAEESSMRKTFALDSFMQKLRRTKTAELEKRERDIAAHSLNPITKPDLYHEVFQKMPVQKRKRRFLDIKSRNKDILLCPKRQLSDKWNFSDSDCKVKNDFIHKCYMDMLESESTGTPSEKDISRYLFKKEAEMYRNLRSIEGAVSYKKGCIYLPDGSISVPVKDMEPHELLHKINTIYAALFGFSGEDVKDSDWLYNAIRASYTDEGVALYRLSMIQARKEGRM